jgi:signal transduction histidine kinase
MAHNLRGPVSNIKMLSQILLKHFKPETAAASAIDDIFTVEEAAEMIEESSVSLLQNLQDLMEIAQMGLNKQVEFDLCNVKIILSEILHQLSVIIQEKKAVFKVNIQVEIIHYPKVYLQSILYNLISNALKYSQPEKPVTINVIVDTTDNKTRIIIQDNGLGIDLEKYGSRIFKLNQFFHTGFDSKGIGLYITKTKIESLGGSIKVESKVNEGAKFTVIL